MRINTPFSISRRTGLSSQEGSWTRFKSVNAWQIGDGSAGKKLLEWKVAVEKKQKESILDFYPGPAIPREVWQEVFQVELENETLELFIWPDGEFEFESGSIALKSELSLNLGIQPYIAQALSRSNQWERIQRRLPKENQVPAIKEFSDNPDLPEKELSDQQWKVLAHVDGRRDLHALATMASLSFFDTCEALLQLADAKYVHWIQMPEIKPHSIQPQEPIKEESRSFLGRLTAKEKPSKEIALRSPVSLVAQLENRLLDNLQLETNSDFETAAFLQNQWNLLWADHPLLDLISLEKGRLDTRRFEGEIPLWENPSACEDSILESLGALGRLIESTYHVMSDRLGEKKAQGFYRKEYDQLFRSEKKTTQFEELTWLNLTRFC